MKEIGKVVGIKGTNALVEIERHEACGDCHACEVGTDKKTMRTTARNDASADIGDAVAVEMEFGNVLKATCIMYGIPLIGFILGCALGYWLSAIFASDQVLTAFFSGIIIMVLTYLGIHQCEKKGLFSAGGYAPVVTEIIEKTDENNA